MKKTLVFLALGFLVQGIHSIRAQDLSETPKELMAQTRITRTAIEGLISHLVSRRVDAHFKATDYFEQLPDLRNRVEKALTKFEETLQKDIFAKLSDGIIQYNAIALSSQFSGPQKELILKERLPKLRKQVEILGLDYKKALSKLYVLIPNYDLQENIVCDGCDEEYKVKESFKRQMDVRLVTNKNRDFKSHFIVNVEGRNGEYQVGSDADVLFADGTSSRGNFDFRCYRICSFGDGRRKLKFPGSYEFYRKHPLSAMNFPELRAQVYREFVHPSISGTCKSQLCLSLRSYDQKLLLDLVQGLSRDIHLKLADGQTLSLDGSDIYTGLMKSYLESVEYFPKDLPFDL